MMSSPDEILEERCGEIFLTSKKNIVFHCTLCEMKYDGFGEYVMHLDEHFPVKQSDPIEKVRIKQESQHDSNVCLENNILDETETSIAQPTILENPSEECETSSDTESISNAAEIEQNDNEAKSNECQLSVKEVRKFKCTVCTATCKDISSLKKHVERHKTQRSHQCPKCPKIFYTPLDVKKHLRLHSNEHRFLCTICGKTCLSNFKLKDHMRRHTNQRDYKCSYCEKSFYNGKLLTQHMHIHSNERHHKCNVCEASFTYRKGLLNHMKLHENKRDYKCELCSASFNQQAGLFSHMKSKHKSV